MKKIFLILTTALFLFAGCEQEEPEAKLGVNKNELSFDREGKAVNGETIEVSSTVSWLAISDQEWCVASPRSVKGNATLDVVVQENLGFGQRSAKITISQVGGDLTETITVTQAENEYAVGVNPLELTFNFDGTPGATGDKFTIISNDDWIITYNNPLDKEWCMLSEDNGEVNTTIEVTTEVNKDPNNSRTAILTVTVGDEVSTVTIKQENNVELGESNLFSFDVENYELEGLVNQAARTVSLFYTENAADMVATVTTSTWATINPSPATPRDYSIPVDFTVTSYDGLSSTTYTVSRILPPKYPAGIRPGSAKLMWAVKLEEDLGVRERGITGGIAVTNDYVVVNTRKYNSVYVDRMTGEMLGEVKLGAVSADENRGLRNFYTTADEDGNILVNNLAPNDLVNGVAAGFRIWKLAGVTSSPSIFLQWDNAGKAIGRKVSIKGSINSNAVITAPIHSGNQFARWTVVDGALTSTTPEIITVGDYATWGIHADVVHTSDTDISADYFTVGSTGTYGNLPTWFDGATNQPKAQLPKAHTSYYMNAVDYTVFNNTPYIIHNYINNTNGLVDNTDVVYITDTSNPAGFTATLNESNIGYATGGAVSWVSPDKIYGSKATVNAANGNGTGDVAFKVSESGYYLYVYYMITNGYVVCYRFDCHEEGYQE